eukprot:320237-Chlamydomonas_euryale.AAC.2
MLRTRRRKVRRIDGEPAVGKVQLRAKVAASREQARGQHLCKQRGWCGRLAGMERNSVNILCPQQETG